MVSNSAQLFSVKNPIGYIILYSTLLPSSLCPEIKKNQTKLNLRLILIPQCFNTEDSLQI